MATNSRGGTRRVCSSLAPGLALLALCTTARGQQSRPAPLAAEVSDSVTSGMIALGDSIFHGTVAGGMCFACHGAEAKGTPGLAPDLTSGKWLHGDGSYAFIISTIETGVPKPKEAQAPMPPLGGVKLTPPQVRAVAGYVYSLTHPSVRTGP